jgi:hypothetical protein
MFFYSLFFFPYFYFTSDAFFDFTERLHCRIPAAAWLFVRGLLAAGWRQCCVLRRISFFSFFLQHVIVHFFVKIQFFIFLSKSDLVYPSQYFWQFSINFA